MANNDYITTDCKLTVSKNTAKLDEEIFLYKNDRNIKLLIEIVDNKYRYKSDDLSNLLVKYKASYAQVKWYKNAEVKKEFPIQATDDGKVVFVIEGQLIDEDTELGDYDLQLRLLNESQESIRSLPIIKGAVHILKPLFEEGDIATVNSAVADVSMLSLDGDAIDTYNSDGTYNQTNWGSGDIISSSKLNKLEKVAKDNVDKVNKMPAKSIVEGGKIYLAKEDGTKLDSGTELPAGGTGTSYDDTEIKTDINTIKTDLGTEELTTTAKNVKGAVNEVAAQYKDIANLFTTEQTTNSYKIKYGNKVIAEIPLGSSVPTVIKYTITNTLSNATNSNSVTEIEENQSYTATITPNKGYSINSAIITMGGTNITDSVYNDGNINIPNVTGDLVITVECTEVVTSIDNEKLLDMDLTGLSDGSVTSFTNTVSNDVATISDDKLTNVKNSKVTVDALKAEGSLTYAYIFDKNIGNPIMQGFNFRKYFNSSLYEWNSYGLYLAVFCNENASTNVYFTDPVASVDMRTLPDINLAVFTLNNDGTIDCYLNGKLLCTVPKQDIWKSWNMQYYSITGGTSITTTNEKGSCKPIKHMYIYKGSLTSAEVSYLYDFFHKN